MFKRCTLSQGIAVKRQLNLMVRAQTPSYGQEVTASGSQQLVQCCCYYHYGGRAAGGGFVNV